jgi:hypothetical protein
MMTIDHDLEIIKAKLESYIGMDVEEAIRQITTTRIR